MRNPKEQLIEIKPNIFIAGDDPHFLKKYVHYNPTDADKLFEYARELESKGETAKAYSYFQKSASHGHYEARKLMESITATPVFVHATPHHTSRSPRRNGRPVWLLPWLLLLSLLFFGILFYFLLSNLFHLEKTADTNIFEQHTTNVSATTPAPTKTEELVFSSVLSGIEYYQDTNGVYPVSLAKLYGGAPNNYLSSIPSSFHYKKTATGYALSVDGMDGDASAADGLFSLVFYEEENKLGLLKGTELLALYPVASGKSDIPIRESLVTGRVVNPHGGDGVLGTRGLVLTEDFAIHGTDDPSSVGGNVSAGCLRMTNEDIEELYPYIPIGTPFAVSDSPPPSAPTFSSGLPPFPGITDSDELQGEETPGVIYTWKF